MFGILASLAFRCSDFFRHDKMILIQVVRRDLELVAIGIAEVNRVRDFVVLEFEFDSVLFQVTLRRVEIFAIRPEGEMKHSDLAVR
jgi:hypothetical protein